MPPCSSLFFFFNDTATTEIYTLSLHDALPISSPESTATTPTCCWRGPFLRHCWHLSSGFCSGKCGVSSHPPASGGSGEHTPEIPAPCKIVFRLLLGKKKTRQIRRLPRPSNEQA